MSEKIPGSGTEKDTKAILEQRIADNKKALADYTAQVSEGLNNLFGDDPMGHEILEQVSWSNPDSINFNGRMEEHIKEEIAKYENQIKRDEAELQSLLKSDDLG